MHLFNFQVSPYFVRKLQVSDKRRCWGSETKTSPVGSTYTTSLRFISSPASPSPLLPPQFRLTFPLRLIWKQPPSGLNVIVLLASSPIHLLHWSQSHHLIITKCKLGFVTPLLENIKWLLFTFRIRFRRIVFRIRFLNLAPKPCMIQPQSCFRASLPPPLHSCPHPIFDGLLAILRAQIKCLSHRKPPPPRLGYCPFTYFTFRVPYIASWYLPQLLRIKLIFFFTLPAPVPLSSPIHSKFQEY